jgi:Domain of Unknown Function (DUF928)
MISFLSTFWKKVLALTLGFVLANFLIFPFHPIAQAGLWEAIVSLVASPSKAPPQGRSAGGAGRGAICASLAEDFNVLPYKEPLSKTVLALVPVKPANVSLNQLKQDTVATGSSPENVGGFTVEKHPTFWFYLPYVATPGTSPKRGAQFTLLDETNHPVSNELMTVELLETPRLVKYSLPYALEMGKLYTWYFSVICDAEKLSRNPTVQGWIQQMAPPDGLQNELTSASRFEQYKVYGKHGLWFEAVNSLVDIRRLFASVNRQDWADLFAYFKISAANQPYVLEAAEPTDREVVGNQFPAKM